MSEGNERDNGSTMTTERIPDGLHPKWSIDQNGCNKKPLNADAVVNDLILDNQALKGALEMALNDKAFLMQQNHALESCLREAREERDMAFNAGIETAAQACDRIESHVDSNENYANPETKMAHSECAALCALSIRNCAAPGSVEAKDRIAEVVESFDPFRRIFKINEQLPIQDGSPFSMCVPGIWPTWGEFKRLVAAVERLRTG